MSLALSPCPECARHVRHESPRCPFCDAELAPGFARPIDRPPGRLGRAAILAFRTSLALGAGTLAACGAATGPDTGADAATMTDAGADPGTDASFDAGLDAGPSVRPDAGHEAGITVIPAYGGPVPVFDAGPPPDAGGTGNLYGAPPA